MGRNSIRITILEELTTAQAMDLKIQVVSKIQAVADRFLGYSLELEPDDVSVKHGHKPEVYVTLPGTDPTWICLARSAVMVACSMQNRFMQLDAIHYHQADPTGCRDEGEGAE